VSYKTRLVLGHDWLGEVPIDWSIKRLKYCLFLSKEKNGVEPVGEMLSVSGYRGIEIKSYESDELKRNEDELSDYRVVRPNQLVVNTMWLNYAGLGVSEFTGHVSPAYRAYYLSRQIYPRFLHHLMRSEIYVRGYTKYMQGIRPNSLQIKTDDFNSFPVLIPTWQEQTQIATFLDHETAKIDRLIEKQQRLIELLEEKRQAAISQAVTKGLNTDAQMKDSGVEWLGKVPVHWSLSQLKFHSELIQTGPFGSQLHAEDYVSDGTPLINPSHIADGKIIPSVTTSVDENTRQRLNRHILHHGELVLARRGELGRCAVVKGEHVGAICGTGSIKIKLKKSVAPDYACMLISTEGLKKELSIESKGSTMDNLNTVILGKLVIPVPPIEEQNHILSQVHSMNETYDNTLSLVHKQLRLLNERRTALISAAVTGKIDVRDQVPQDVEEAVAS